MMTRLINSGKKKSSRSDSTELNKVEPQNSHARQLKTQKPMPEVKHGRDKSLIHNSQLTRLSNVLLEENLKLKLANSELEIFSSAVAHDLRTPLSTICMYAQAVLRHCGNNLDEQCHTHIMSILSQTEYMNQLINNIMVFSLASCKEIKKERVDLSGIAHKISANLKLINPERSVEFNLMAGIEVSGDKCLLQDVLENLFGNAWKYTGKKESATIDFGVMDHDGKQAYFVSDNGIGFDMNQAGNLFEIFQRFNCNAEFNGFGIGLATVKRIIQRHGGKVWAKGEPGKGATVYFTL